MAIENDSAVCSPVETIFLPNRSNSSRSKSWSPNVNDQNRSIPDGEFAEESDEKLKLIGVFHVESKKPNEFDEHDAEILQALADQAALALENSYLVEQLREMAITDELTSIYNRRYFKRSLLVEIQKLKRYRQSLSLLYFDIDNFKSYNTSYLHEMGDELLKNLAQKLKEAIRQVDIPARVGGEEFVALLPQTNQKNALISGERFRKTIEEMPPLRPGYRQVTVSVGVTTYTADITPREFVARADAAMFHAKNHGKNQVVVWNPSIPIRQK
ncbi:MAG: hypothetical protein B6244_13740 [Candidatus Cloacimonetes bacterium 4572_55]|nr:MAG: hypothetical protein B6244_13740 [Candidatus Cloacimonetes bacterium 4572_55]